MAAKSAHNQEKGRPSEGILATPRAAKEGRPRRGGALENPREPTTDGLRRPQRWIPLGATIEAPVDLAASDGGSQERQSGKSRAVMAAACQLAKGLL